MLLHNLGTGLLRRWYFVLAGVLLTAAGGLFTWTVVPPSYEASSTAVLLPPSSLVGENGNPYLFMSGLDQVLTVLTVRLNSTEVAEPLIQGRSNVGFTVERDPTTPGPIMRVTASGDSRESALQLLKDVVRIVPENLSVMQDQLRIPTFSRVEVMTVVQDDTPDILIKDQLRTLLAVLAAGLALTVLATAILDRVMTARKNKGRRTQSAAEPMSFPWSSKLSDPVLETLPARSSATSGRRVIKSADNRPHDQEFDLQTLASKK